jgi:hypothetical protein
MGKADLTYKHSRRASSNQHDKLSPILLCRAAV